MKYFDMINLLDELKQWHYEYGSERIVDDLDEIEMYIRVLEEERKFLKEFYNEVSTND